MAATHRPFFSCRNTGRVGLSGFTPVPIEPDENRGNAPIGIFDSGIGGLSVLRHMQSALPQESFVYFADAGFAPYGDKPPAVIAARSLAIAEFLLSRNAKVLVVACNSATATAIDAIRLAYPDLPVVGVEPGLKPGAKQTRTGIVGVLATAATVSSPRFHALRAQIESEMANVRFIARACVGLADKIERGELRSVATIRLLREHVIPLLADGADTLVLGCTHYPFVRPTIESLTASHSVPVAIVDTAEAVTRQLCRHLTERGLAQAEPAKGDLQVFTTGKQTSIQQAFARLLGLSISVHCVEAA